MVGAKESFIAPIATALLMAAFVLVPARVAAQDQTASRRAATASPEATRQSLLKARPPANSLATHTEFWDETNILLFSGVTAARGLDYASTLQFRARGRQELLLNNSIVDNKPLFLSIELATAAASVGISYWLHRRGNHRLERLVSIAHMGAGVGGAIHNYELAAPVRH